MDKKTEKKNLFQKLSTQTWLMIVCGVLLLALIVVSALAYTWHRDLKAVAYRAKMLQISASSVDSLSTEINNLTLEKGNLEAQLEQANAKIAELEAAAKESAGN